MAPKSTNKQLVGGMVGEVVGEVVGGMVGGFSLQNFTTTDYNSNMVLTQCDYTF